MATNPDTNETCIICLNNLPIKSNATGEDAENVGIENPTGSTVSENCSRKDAKEDNSLSAFFLGKFLKYELLSGKDEEDLMESISWKNFISFCPSCLEWVVEARKLHLKITELQEKLESYRKLVEDKVVETFNKKEAQITTNSGNSDAIYNNVRQKICSNHLWVGLGFTDGEESGPAPTVDPQLLLMSEFTVPNEVTLFKDEPDDTRNEEFENNEWSCDFNNIVIEPDNASGPQAEDCSFETTERRKSRRGRPKSRAISRTCRICHVVFDMPSQMTRHFTECHLDINAKDADGDYQNITDDTYEIVACKPEDFSDDKPNMEMENENELDALGNGTDEDYNYESNFSEDDEIEEDWDEKKLKKKRKCVSGSSKEVFTPGSGPGRKKTKGESRTCPVCQRVFDRPHRMRRHLNFQHSSNCKKQRLEALQSHEELNVSLDVGDDEANISTNCDPYKRNSSRRGPKQSSTESRTCKVCSKVFNKPSRMMKHMQSRHNVHKTTKIDGNQAEVDKRTDRLDAIQGNEILQVHDEDGQEVSNVEKKVNERALTDCIQPSEVPEAIGRRRKLKLVNYKVTEKEGGIGDADADFLDDDPMDSGKLSGNEDCDFLYRSGTDDESDTDHNHKSTKPAKVRVKKKLDLNDSEMQDLINSFESRICPICKKLFDDSKGVDEHLKSTHEKSENEIFSCNICGKRFVGETSLKLHMKCHEKKGLIINKRSFKCSFEGCEWAFKTARDLATHENRHTGVKDHLCSLCGATFGHRSSFLRHKTICNNTSTPYVCETCGKRFKTLKYLDQHLSSKFHGGPGNKSQHRRKGDLTTNNNEVLNESTEAEDNQLMEMNVLTVNEIS